MRYINLRPFEQAAVYRIWHTSRLHEMIHWFAFVFVAVLLTSIFVAAINASAMTYSGSAYTTGQSFGVSQNSYFLESVSSSLERAQVDRTRVEPVQDHIIVKFKTGISAAKRQDIYKRHKLTDKDEISQIGIKVVTISSDYTPEEVVERIKAQDREAVEFAEVDAIVRPDIVPNDPYYNNQWHLPKIAAPAAWDNATGTGAIVAILDTGVDCTHPDLASSCVPGWNFYDNNNDSSDVYGHGTKVAGAAAAIMNNAAGVAGVCGNCKIMPIRIAAPNGGGSTLAMAKGLTFAADHGARAANISYMVSTNSTVKTAAQYFQSKGGVVTISAGNYSTLVQDPDNPYVLTVSATVSTDAMASFSNTGNIIDVAAPGSGIYLTTKGGGYGSASGTSFSAPITAAVAALVISANPALTGEQVQAVVKQTSDDLGSAGWDVQYGWGRVNADKAVALALSGVLLPPPPDTIPPTIPENLVASAPDSTKVNLTWSASSDNLGVAGYRVYRSDLLIATVSGSIYVDPSVVSGLTYSYSVSAIDAAQNVSERSAPVSILVPQPSLTLISHQVTKKGATSAEITWKTSIPSTGMVAYGTSATDLSQTVSDTGLSTTHTATINGLSKSTKYYYQISSIAGDGMSVLSPISTFRTANK